MTKTCGECGVAFEARSSRAVWCSDRCRKRNERRPAGGSVHADTVADTAGVEESAARVLSDFEAATLAELVRLDHEGTMLGHQAMVLARRVSSDGESGATVAALSKEHTRLMALVAARAKAQQDPVEKARSAAPYVYRGNAVPPERGAPTAAAS